MFNIVQNFVYKSIYQYCDDKLCHCISTVIFSEIGRSLVCEPFVMLTRDQSQISFILLSGFDDVITTGFNEI